jgi:hypothetical protein
MSTFDVATVTIESTGRGASATICGIAAASFFASASLAMARRCCSSFFKASYHKYH